MYTHVYNIYTYTWNEVFHWIEHVTPIQIIDKVKIIEMFDKSVSYRVSSRHFLWGES